MARKPRSVGIVRIDIGSEKEGTKQTHGWQARVYRGKVTHSKFFSDSKFKGKNGAKAAAEKWRDSKLKELGPPPERPGRGGPAVYIYRTEIGGYPVWSIVWRDKAGKQSQTRVSIAQNGVKRGKELAEAKAAHVRAKLDRGVAAGMALRGFKAEEPKAKASGKKSKKPASRSRAR